MRGQYASVRVPDGVNDLIAASDRPVDGETAFRRISPGVTDGGLENRFKLCPCQFGDMTLFHDEQISTQALVRHLTRSSTLV
jgi:hypothetical protein